MTGPNKLRDAATRLREDHQPCICGDVECPAIFFENVALLLEIEANAWDAQESRATDDGWPDLTVNHARRSLLTDIAESYR